MTVRYYKMRLILLQNVTAFLLRNAIEVHYKMQQFYYKMLKLLEIAILLQNATICDSTVNIQKCL